MTGWVDRGRFFPGDIGRKGFAMRAAKDMDACEFAGAPTKAEEKHSSVQPQPTAVSTAVSTETTRARTIESAETADFKRARKH